jgi:hypothetical protein
MHGLLPVWIIRALVVAAILSPAACSQSAPPPAAVYAPPSYTYLKPLRLNVAAVEIEESWAPGPDDAGALSPVRPLEALRRMAQDRLIPSGNAGRAVFRIQDAALHRFGDRLDGHLAVQLDIYGPDGKRRGYAEARVSRATFVPAGEALLRQELYSLTRQMMDDMNVEFEYQARHALHAWIEEASPPASAVPAPVERQQLPPPGM